MHVAPVTRHFVLSSLRDACCSSDSTLCAILSARCMVLQSLDTLCYRLCEMYGAPVTQHFVLSSLRDVWCSSHSTLCAIVSARSCSSHSTLCAIVSARSCSSHSTLFTPSLYILYAAVFNYLIRWVIAAYIPLDISVVNSHATSAYECELLAVTWHYLPSVQLDNARSVIRP